jgi:gamma-glutamylcyclotransferase (GGCT)/AIG2-like uncharacterized protein YtfP
MIVEDDEGKDINMRHPDGRPEVIVFVYGTLKREHGNHHVMERGKAEYVDNDEIRGLLFASPGRSSIPFLKLTGEDAWVKGEVFKCSPELVQRLDSFEGHPRFYQRTEVKLRSGRMAFVYVYAEVPYAPPVPNNVWPYGEAEITRHVRQRGYDNEQV